ncbi:carbohydrate ABC transporter substrate-binding protein [Fredinandcohnia onubensis]|uniref:carbohydrate ABC transporter substrate-binding protein n=1 Tax=Fredinandcohnia onubensis TaxID=1571209 RepID=UPI000C0C0449|nr:carbohydrate ABC transporter substrate-binding protein [Fredinandcohnia onubensis]
MKTKRLLLAITFSLFLLVLAACSGDKTGSTSTSEGSGKTESSEKVTLHVAALESAYGSDMWTKMKEAYEAKNENVTIELTVEKNLEEVVRPNMQAGEYPDVFLLATGRPEALTETLIKENGLEDITDVLDMKVYGEAVTVGEKLLDGFTDTLATNPYADGKTYLGPMFYSPTGLFYNTGLFEEKGWEVPTTWDEMWELGEKAAEEGISLFTYPTTGYFDTVIGSMLYASGGTDFYNSAMKYEDGVWESNEAKRVLETIGKLADFTHPNTVANANPNDFTKNQQLILDNKALFMPNGTWVVGEMAEAPRAENFKWGMTPLPAYEEGGERYAFTFFEQIWIPAAAKNKDAAKDFVTFVYSDEAASIFLEAGAVQPIDGITEQLDGDNLMYYSIYDDGVLPAMGTFASTQPVPGVSMGDTLYGSIDSVISGKLSYEEWQKKIEEVSDKLRPAMN